MYYFKIKAYAVYVRYFKLINNCTVEGRVRIAEYCVIIQRKQVKYEDVFSYSVVFLMSLNLISYSETLVQ